MCITFVDYERPYISPPLTNLPPVSGAVANRIHVLIRFPISKPNSGPGVEGDSTDVDSSHTGRGGDCYISIATLKLMPPSPADNLPQ